MPAPAPAGSTLGEAVRDFLARDDLGPATLRSYRQTLERLSLAVGGGLPLTTVTAPEVARAFSSLWGSTSAKTWNRHLSAIRSFSTWSATGDLAATLERRPETRPRITPITATGLEAVWGLDLPLRERALWRLLHESAAGVRTVLSLNVEDLDLEDRRARAGATWVTWRSGAARLLDELLGGRTRGPVFLADRRPGPGRMPPEADRCPDTGRGRLSYERAEYLFKKATGPLDPDGRGFTLRRLKPFRDAGPGNR
nr:site-specific integrase [Actinoplanes friuliensis]